jgi:hypothetical protein
MKCVLRNNHSAPSGVYDVSGQLVMIPPGGEVEADLTEAEAAALIREKGFVECRRSSLSGAASAEDDSADGEPEADDEGGDDSAQDPKDSEAGEAGAESEEDRSRRKSVAGRRRKKK